MERRWIVLGMVCFARSGVGFQFVAIAALMLQLKADLGINHAQIGVLLGLFLIAGVFLSLPAGMIASRIGDHLALRIGLIALIVGAALVAIAMVPIGGPAVLWVVLAPAFYIAARLLHGHANPS